MKEVKLNGRFKFEIHTDEEQLPAVRYKDYNKFMLLDSGVGSSITDINVRYSTLFKLLSSNKVSDALKEAENLFYTHYYILNGINHKQRAFACLIHSIQGKSVTDYSVDALDKIILQLSAAGLTQDIVNKFTEDIKKKIRTALRSHFPALFPDDDELTFYQHVKRKIMALTETIENEIHAIANNKVIAEIDEYFLELMQPMDFSDSPENAVIRYETSYQDMCAAIESVGASTEGLTVLQLYSKLNYYHKKNKPETNES